MQNRIKGRDVKTRVMEPMTRVELLVFARTYALRSNGTIAPFSCRHYGYKQQIEQVTVIDLVMPLRSDTTGEPILRTMEPEAYYQMNHTMELRSELCALLEPLLEVARYGTYHDLLQVHERLIGD